MKIIAALGRSQSPSPIENSNNTVVTAYLSVALTIVPRGAICDCIFDGLLPKGNRLQCAYPLTIALFFPLVAVTQFPIRPEPFLWNQVGGQKSRMNSAVASASGGACQ